MRAVLVAPALTALVLLAAPRVRAAWEQPPHRATLYLNFNGGHLTPGNNSALMQMTCGTQALDYPAYAGTEGRATFVVQELQAHLAPYGVRLAINVAPPPELPYSLIMFGGTGLGIDFTDTLAHACNYDCGDAWWRDTMVVFTEQTVSSDLIAQSTIHEFGHMVGLDDVASSDLVMQPFGGDGQYTWGSECVANTTAAVPTKCGAVHKEFCPDGSQNAHAELLAYFGPNTPDIQPPTVEIVAPLDGAEIAGSDLAIEATVADDHEGFGWKLVLRSEGEVLLEEPAFKRETTWALTGLPAGVYQVEVAAVDHDRNVGSHEVTVYLDVPAPAPGTSSSGEALTEVVTAGPESGGGSSSGGSSTVGETSDAGSCTCRTEGSWSGAGLGLFGLALLRRRRGARSQ